MSKCERRRRRLWRKKRRIKQAARLFSLGGEGENMTTKLSKAVRLRRIYIRKRNRARIALRAVVIPARKAFLDVRIKAREEYRAAVIPAYEAYKEAIAEAREKAKK